MTEAMLRQRHSSQRPWLYIFASFVAGAIIAYFLISRKGDKVLSWQELDKKREALSQQSLISGAGEDIVGGGRKRVMAVVGVQVDSYLHGMPERDRGRSNTDLRGDLHDRHYRS